MNERRDVNVRGLLVCATIMVLLFVGGPALAQDTPKEQVTVGGSGVIEELHIRDIDIRRAIEMLSGQVRRNIIATKEVTGKVTVDLYGVTFHEALDAILHANGFAYIEKGSFIYVMTAEQKVQQENALRKRQTKMFRLSYVTATDVQTLITPLLSSEGSVAITPPAETGITPGSTDAGGNSYATDDVLVVTDFEDNLRRIGEAIRTLDIRPEQVLIEATLLRASLSEDNALGVDFNVLSGTNFDAMAGVTAGIQDVTTGSVPALVDHRAMTVKTDFNGSIPQGGLTVGFLSNNVGVFVRALESVTDVTVMANPKLLVINKMRGEVFVGREDGYLTTTFTETTATETVEMLKTGTRLVVRPYIGRDDYVRMEIHPEDSSGSVASIGLSALPNKATTEVTSNVIVRDGHTIVIGGLFREETSVTRSQTPGLGNVPYLGALLRSTSDATDREEVIILITPRIIRNGADDVLSEQLKDDTERFRIGARKGLRWWGRSRLSAHHVRKARSALTVGDRDKAMWHVDAALSMTPQLAEAIQLKERLTGRAYWADSVRSSSAKFIIQKMIMNDLGKSVDPVIPHRKPRNGADMDKDARKALGAGKLIESPLEIGTPPKDEDADKAESK